MFRWGRRTTPKAEGASPSAAVPEPSAGAASAHAGASSADGAAAIDLGGRRAATDGVEEVDGFRARRRSSRFSVIMREASTGRPRRPSELFQGLWKASSKKSTWDPSAVPLSSALKGGPGKRSRLESGSEPSTTNTASSAPSVAALRFSEQEELHVVSHRSQLKSPPRFHSPRDDEEDEDDSSVSGSFSFGRPPPEPNLLNCYGALGRCLAACTPAPREHVLDDAPLLLPEDSLVHHHHHHHLDHHQHGSGSDEQQRRAAAAARAAAANSRGVGSMH